ncbi:MAG TPA: hypothetical protein VFA17_10435 [Thermoplasmata archaeon]|nr:hypothetical protein [Thermoplasmata archaeon]
MQVGCGVYAHTVRGKRYLYFWHYETRGGSRVQVKEYVGPAASSRARSDAIQHCEDYYARAAEELVRMRDVSLTELRSMGGH